MSQTPNPEKKAALEQRAAPEVRQLPGVDLGYHGAVRFRVAPRVELEPSTEPVTVDTVRIASFPLKGAVKNLKETVDCRLEWKVLVSIAGVEKATERTVTHPRPTVLVPSGATYEIKERGASGPVPLVVDAFELDLMGTGLLGYTLELQLVGQASKRVASATSSIKVDLPVTVTASRPGTLSVPREPSDREAWVSASEGSTAELEARVGDAIAGGSVRSQMVAADDTLKVGELVSLEVEPARAFIGHPLRLDVAEYTSDAHEGEGTRSTFVWTPTGPGKQTHPWRVGMVGRGESQVLAPSLVEAGTRFFRWTVSAYRSSAPPAGSSTTAGVVPEADVVTSSSVQFCTAEHPRLAEFLLAERGASTTEESLSDLFVSATFEHLDPSLELDMELELMVRTEKPSPRLVQLSKLLSELGRTDEVKTSARVRMGALDQAVVRLSDCREALRRFDPGLGLFGVLSFGPAAVATQGSCVFNTVVGYTPNLESAPSEAGFAPFRAGWLTRPEVGSGVCTKLRTLEGESVDLAGGAAIPQPLWNEYRVFLAIVVGEAGSSTESSWRGVAHAMLNRRNGPFPEWRDFTSLEKVASAPGQFNAFGRAQFREAMAYFERKYVKKDAVDRTEAEKKFARMEEVLIPLFMAGLGERREAGWGPHNGWGVNYFFSPKPLAKEGKPPPAWSRLYDDLTGHFPPPGGGVNQDFRFYRRRPEHGA